MQSIISKWNGKMELNGKSISKAFDFSNVSGPVSLILTPSDFTNNSHTEQKANIVEPIDYTGSYRISVKRYMTKPATPEFDFMTKWNNNIPMPLMTMVGEKIKETKGMVYMELHGDITAKITGTCLCCGKAITNPVSRYFGMGPKCGGHNYVNPFESEEELKIAVNGYRKKLQEIKWSGWIVKSAITEEVRLENN